MTTADWCQAIVGERWLMLTCMQLVPGNITDDTRNEATILYYNYCPLRRQCLCVLRRLQRVL